MQRDSGAFATHVAIEKQLPPSKTMICCDLFTFHIIFIQDPRDYDTHSAHTNVDTYERLLEPDMKQAAVVIAVFLYNTAQRDAMMPRRPLPHPELEEQLAKPLEGIYPAAVK